MEKLYDATCTYRHHSKVLTLSTLATVAVHLLFSLGLWCFALGLFSQAPSPLNHIVIYSTGNCGSMIPLSAGPLEYFLDVLYPQFPISGGTPAEAGYGSLVGIVYRLSTIVIAAAGGVYSLCHRAEIGVALSQMRQDETAAETAEKAPDAKTLS